jgi:GntP family gluconate:H+ symporter
MHVPPEVALLLAVVFVAMASARTHSLVVLFLAAAGFAAVAGLSISQLGKSFGTGFGQTLNTLGLPVLAAAMVVARTGPLPAAFLSGGTGAASTRRDRLRMAWLAAIGTVAGMAASAGAVMAVLRPLQSVIARNVAPRRGALTLGLAISAGQGLLLPSPVVIAAMAILGAPWQRVVALGVPLAVLSAGVGAIFAARVLRADDAVIPPDGGARTGVAALAVPCVIMAAMLIVQSMGDFPSEPLGGGASRELVLGIGRPLIVLLAGVGIMVVTTRAARGWVDHSIMVAAPLMLLLGAAGGLQALCQSTHAAELAAEKLLPLKLGLALPFLVATVLKVLQGSSLAAAITASGMVAPLLGGLGLDDPTGHALAVLAVGAGAMSGAHVNDGLFWLIADGAGLRPARALAVVTGGTVLQGLVVLAALAALWLA